MPRLEYRVLGPVELRADGERVSIESPKQRLLLAVLLVQAGRARHRGGGRGPGAGAQ